MTTLRVRPGRPIAGAVEVPGDKSIAHRLLILAAIADGSCELTGVPASEDVLSTARCLQELLPDLRPELQAWNSSHGLRHEAGRFTSDRPQPRPSILVRGKGRAGLDAPEEPLMCGNSGTTLRLLLGVLAAGPGTATLIGDESLSGRPLERVAGPLRDMGADIVTTDGHAPAHVRAARLHGVEFVPEVPSAQVKSAILLAGLAAEGVTQVVERVQTRDHTERLLGALGLLAGPGATVRAAEVPSFSAEVPGDPSGAAFLAGAALCSGGGVSVAGVGLNPSRLGFLEALGRMGADVRTQVDRTSLDEPIGTLDVTSGSSLRGIDMDADAVAGAIDEIPALAFLAASAQGQTRFRGVAELRVKESDRVTAIVEGIRALGGEAEADDEGISIGGGGLRGGTVDPRGDHRIAMAAAMAGLATREEVRILGAGCVNVSFPGFVETLRRLGADVEG